MNLLWEAFWFFLPAGIANMSPVLIAKLPGLRNWNTPMDFDNTWRGKPIFGKNKTWRGLIFGTFAAGLVGLLQYKIAPPYGSSAFVAFTSALAMGYGALVGDAVESFFKRQRGVKPGGRWIPFDQIDYIIGGLAFAYLIEPIPLKLMLAVLVLYAGLHLLTSYIGYRLKLKSHPI